MPFFPLNNQDYLIMGSYIEANILDIMGGFITNFGFSLYVEIIQGFLLTWLKLFKAKSASSGFLMWIKP